jgi:hypothetical protein
VPIDDSKKLLFLHIPKKGGSSVERSLNLHPHQVSDPQKFLSGTEKHLQHLTYEEVLGLKRGESLYNYNTFCIIRNLIDRFFSEFQWRKKINHLLTSEMNVKMFAKHLIYLKEDRKLHRECHFRFQSDYFYVNGKPAENIKVFRLEDGMQKVQDWLSNYCSIKIEIPHANSTKKIVSLRSAEILNLVKIIYGEDAEKLEYQL